MRTYDVMKKTVLLPNVFSDNKITFCVVNIFPDNV